MNIQILKNDVYDNEDKFPVTATNRSSGYDIIAISDPEFIGLMNSDGSYAELDYIQYKTNLKLAVQKTNEIDYDVLAFPRSSISKYNLVLANSIGLIDSDYRGEVILRFKYIWQPIDYKITINNNIIGSPNLNKIYKKGDKICQLKTTKIERVEFTLVEVLDNTERNEGGFGSSDTNQLVNQAKHQMSTIETLYTKVSSNESIKLKYTDRIKERDQQHFNQ